MAPRMNGDSKNRLTEGLWLLLFEKVAPFKKKLFEKAFQFPSSEEKKAASCSPGKSTFLGLIPIHLSNEKYLTSLIAIRDIISDIL